MRTSITLRYGPGLDIDVEKSIYEYLLNYREFIIIATCLFWEKIRINALKPHRRYHASWSQIFANTAHNVMTSPLGAPPVVRKLPSSEKLFDKFSTPVRVRFRGGLGKV